MAEDSLMNPPNIISEFSYVELSLSSFLWKLEGLNRLKNTLLILETSCELKLMYIRFKLTKLLNI